MKDITNTVSENLYEVLKDIQQELDEDTLMQPLSWARIQQLNSYKELILTELKRREES